MGLRKGQVVRVRTVPGKDRVNHPSNARRPIVGDTGVVVRVLWAGDTLLFYRVECTTPEGERIWEGDFLPSEVEPGPLAPVRPLKPWQAALAWVVSLAFVIAFVGGPPYLLLVHWPPASAAALAWRAAALGGGLFLAGTLAAGQTILDAIVGGVTGGAVAFFLAYNTWSMWSRWFF